MASFDVAIEQVLLHEGGYSNDPNDAGGETKYGISKRSFPQVDIANLTLDEAKRLYRQVYWLYESVEDQGVANKLLDMGVHMGTSRTIRYLQTILDINSDGQFGPRTLEATNRMPADNLIKELRIACAIHYARICSYNPKQLKYINGWMRRAFS